MQLILEVEEQECSSDKKSYQADPYFGFFMRHFVGETASDPTDNETGISQSPDIIVTGNSIAHDPSVYTTRGTNKGNYDDTSPQTNGLEDGLDNYVYCRGINSATLAQDARLWLFYVTSNVLLLPQNWGEIGVVTGHLGNYLDIKNVPPGTVGLTTPPFILDKSVVKRNTHYCLVTIVENPPFNNPPSAPIPGAVNSWDEMIKFINGSPTFAWLNTIEITTKGEETYLLDQVANVPEGGEFSIGVQFHNMPANDGSAFSFTVAGPDKENSIDFPKTSITNGNGRYAQKVTWGPEFQGSYISVTYYPGSKTPPAGAGIRSSVWQGESAVRRALQNAGFSPDQINKRIDALPNVATYELSDANRVGYPKYLEVGSVHHVFPS